MTPMEDLLRLVVDEGASDLHISVGAPPAIRLRGERTAFVPAGDPECVVTVVQDAHEMPFERLKVSQLRTDVGYDVPVVCATRSGRTHFAISQAYLDGYTGASMWREGSRRGGRAYRQMAPLGWP